MRNNWVAVFVGAMFVGGVISVFASSSPDGLEKIAGMQGFFEQGRAFFVGVIPGYMMPGVHSEKLATSLAGVIGASTVFSILIFIGKYLYAFESKEK